jgi:hypothetical protein
MQCTRQFGPDLGEEYQCVKFAGHEGFHVDQYDNRWSR